MPNPEESRGDPPAPNEPDNLSAFVARVLNQLSLSAWLPGAFFIVCLSALAWFQYKGALTVADSGSFVQHHWVLFLVLSLPALVIATLLTQAFSFEAIRVLEGYWHGPASWVTRLFIERQLRRKTSLVRKYDEAYASAFDAVRRRLLKQRVDALVVLALEADATYGQRPIGLTDEHKRYIDEFDLEDHCDPWDGARLVRLDMARNEFPDDSRIMPTALGNTLRAAEDKLENSGDLEGFVMRSRSSIPTRVLQHHDQFRTRLDMYCLLVFASAVAAAASIPMLWDLPPLSRILAALALIIMSAASYSAALASARGYGTVLHQIDTILEDANSEAG